MSHGARSGRASSAVSASLAALVRGAPGPRRLLVDTKVGNLKSGPFAPQRGLAIQIQPPSRSMFVRTVGTRTMVSFASRSSLTVKKASPSFTLLSPTILPFRRMLFPINTLVSAGVCSGVELPWCRGCCLVIVIWAPILIGTWSMSRTNTTESMSPQPRDLCPSKRMVWGTGGCVCIANECGGGGIE